VRIALQRDRATVGGDGEPTEHKVRPAGRPADEFEIALLAAVLAPNVVESRVPRLAVDALGVTTASS
jgi:hypothetical protein